MERTLSKFLPNEHGIVKRVVAVGKLKRRLLDMGVTSGAEITLRRIAPLGDPLEVTIRGYELTLRSDEADVIILETEGNV
ncbi:MAG: ferrous iron transport protein A [Christensenellaceae bacterium]|jgi:ferrous iron transport protein A|nr:ferrous iron transport protein A [Christensenellaceae bacterium]